MSYGAQSSQDPVSHAAVRIRADMLFGIKVIGESGVTAGVDFGLGLLAALRGDEAAKTVQLMMEYDPAPPFDVGTPEKAERTTIENAQSILNASAECRVMIDRQKEWGFPLERNFPSNASA